MHGNHRGRPLLTCHANTLSNMVPCFLKSRQQAHIYVIHSFRIFKYGENVLLFA